MCLDDLYIIPDEAEREETDGAWIQPRSIDDIVVDAILETTDYEVRDLDQLSAYVDDETLASLFDDGTDLETLSFEVDGYKVTVNQSGAVDVAEAE